MTGTIFLITENDTDVQAVKAILKAKGYSVKIHKYPYLPEGISELVKELEKFILSVKPLCTKKDCIAVLHDADELVGGRDENIYKQITNICKKHKIAEIIAQDEIEAWLLADEGVRAWLEYDKKGQTDSVRKPSDLLNSLFKKKTGRDYRGSDRQKLLDKLTGVGDYNDSFKEALTYLDDAPCVKS
jgi:hypothetical protein